MATTEISSSHSPHKKNDTPFLASDAIQEREISPRANHSHLHPARAQKRQGRPPGRVGDWNHYILVPSHKRLFGPCVQSTPWVHTWGLQGSIPGTGKHETLHPTPHTLHPTPYALHLLHPTLYTSSLQQHLEYVGVRCTVASPSPTPSQGEARSSLDETIRTPKRKGEDALIICQMLLS